MPFWGKKKEEAAPQQENAGAESNVMGAEEGPGGALSALRENIKQKQANAYYYAHATRDTGEAPAPMPTHVVLERSTVSEQVEKTEVSTCRRRAGRSGGLTEKKAIASYQMLDDEDLGVVKVYIPLAGIGSIAKDKEAPKKRVDPEVVQLDLTESSMSIEIRKYKPNTALKLWIKELNKKIDPSGSTVKSLDDKIVVRMKKAAHADKWSKLSA